MIKKGICFLLCCLILLVGCHGKIEQSVYEIFCHIKSRIEIPDCEIYHFVADDSQNHILSRLYSQEGDIVPPAVAFCDDYLICLYHGNDVWELHIFRTVSIYDNKRIYEMLVMRRDLLQKNVGFSYYSEETEKRVMAAEIINYRNFIVLAVTDHNSIIRDEFENMK